MQEKEQIFYLKNLAHVDTKTASFLLLLLSFLAVAFVEGLKPPGKFKVGWGRLRQIKNYDERLFATLVKELTDW